MYFEPDMYNMFSEKELEELRRFDKLTDRTPLNYDEIFYFEEFVDNELLFPKNTAKCKESLRKKRYYQKHKDKIIKKKQQYQLKNSEKVNNNKKTYNITNKDRISAYNRHYYLKSKLKLMDSKIS